MVNSRHHPWRFSCCKDPAIISRIPMVWMICRLYISPRAPSCRSAARFWEFPVSFVHSYTSATRGCGEQGHVKLHSGHRSYLLRPGAVQAVSTAAGVRVTRRFRALHEGQFFVRADGFSTDLSPRCHVDCLLSSRRACWQWTTNAPAWGFLLRDSCVKMRWNTTGQVPVSLDVVTDSEKTERGIFLWMFGPINVWGCKR